MLTTEVVRKQVVVAATLNEVIALEFELRAQWVFVSARAGNSRLSSILAFVLAQTASYLLFPLPQCSFLSQRYSSACRTSSYPNWNIV